MDAWRSWLKEPFGKKLKRLHAWNAWLIVLLAITGIILYIPSIRGDLGAFRVFLKQLHIGLGLLSIVIILMYSRHIPKHWKQISQKINQRWNLFIVLLLLAGWSVTGILLWQFRSLSPVWSNTALVLHDLFTWLGIPYAIYHSISRSRWLKAMKREEKREAISANLQDGAASTGTGRAGAAADDPQERIRYWQKAPISRSAFIRWLVGLAVVFGVGPSFYRWIKTAADNGGTELEKLAGEDANRMLPVPEALPESNPPLGGGGQGQFRIYTVTEIPAFSSDHWSFTVAGLVEKPQSWSWEELLKLKRKVQVSDFHCVTGWSVYKVTWEGIPLSELLDMVNVKSTGRFVKMYSGDKVYTDCLSLEQARMEDVMVAVLMDGKPIPQKLGGPVRLIVPQMYAYKSVKWLQAIELIDKEHMGYWEVRGYDNDAWVSKNRLS
ncbi:molybdopterin-dependent oxidoreductase [Paenibacillus sp. OAS669]|uniref:molybdopterin-dependent oxidoreductase n=1 Tax=Paenibacillus sp. OAS669 TaxID=2663821 RepID=UPI00178AC3D1|nr:molybdopterin-dependent oxidoreductase [Paenibacillus sp. OAS669]MBE1442218.1 DMSO/TMAO reductase YedYZ molybdopterin-dependent catalytic subunit [Paenibacillus sp. OAS669]